MAVWADRLRPAVLPELATVRRPAEAEAAAAEARAHARLREAEREAQALVEAARQRAAALLQEGHREGQRRGRAEALQEAQARLRPLGPVLEAAARQLRALEEEFRTQGSEAIVSLALAVADRIVRGTLAHDPEATLRNVRAALAALPDPGGAVVRVHPEQHALLQEHRDELLGAAEGARAIRFQADPTVEFGGCIVDTPGSLVDATVARQLDEARRRLLDGPC
jgi:flagellar biosynthesis/type III secretory pathway protein FliH